MRNFFIIFIILLSLFTITYSNALAQDESSAPVGPESVQDGGIRSYWNLTENAKEFRWPLFLTFIIGMVLVVKKVVELLFDWKEANAIYKYNFSRFKRKDQIEHFAHHHKCVASELILLLMKSLQTAPDASQFNDELEKFYDQQKQRFSTFQNRMSFWSDTAGALGLLGTVWGMFVTFFKGDMDKQNILSGMGIALITTLMGLVISVILNFFATEVSGLFNRMLGKLGDVKQRLYSSIIDMQPLNYASVSVGRGGSKRETGIGNSAESQQSPKGNQKEHASKTVSSTRQTESVEYKLNSISGHSQRCQLMQQSVEPFVVELNIIKNGKQEKVIGESIIFSVEKNLGKFDNGKNKMVVPTDRRGRAEVYFTPLKANGKCKIIVSHETSTIRPIHFNVEVVKMRPSDILIKSGNNQSSVSGTILPEPLVVQVVDERGNPMSNTSVKFSVTMGNGVFPNNKQVADVATDGKGLAHINFRLGKDNGFNAIQVECPDLTDKQISFQALGQ